MKQHTLLPKIWLPVCVCLFFLAAACFFLCRRHIDWSYTPAVQTETAALLKNPYQGFYRLRGYLLSDENPNLEEQIQAPVSWDKDYSIALLEINLKRYQYAPISDAALAQLDQIFSAWSASGKQLIVRFLYDWDGKGLESEPTSLDQILTHMEQVAPVVNRYADHIYLLQGIFVGAYAEMHTSNYLQNDTMKTLMTHLADLTDPSIFLSVRTPWQWRVITDRMTLPDPFPGFDGSLPSRLGLFNDGMLGSVYDLGTYGDASAALATEPNQKRTRKDELDFQNTLCQYVPNGGEVVLDNPFNDLKQAIADLSVMHVSYLNAVHDGAVMEKWKSSVYTDDDIFSGCSGYDYIAAHLGYRYVLRDSTLSFDTWKDDAASFSVTIDNVGFGNSLKAFPVSLSIVEETTSEVTAFDIPADVRTLLSGSRQAFEQTIPLRELKKGTYRIYLKMTDVSGEQTILFANDSVPDTHGYFLGTLSIE